MWIIVAIMIVLFWLVNYLGVENKTFYSYVELFALLSIPILLLYNGDKGQANNKWLFYIFYPAHILIIYLISLLL